MNNSKLQTARKNKRDEFFTQLADVEREVSHYVEQLRGKRILCNCDDPNRSNFYTYFKTHFRELGLKEVVVLCYLRGCSGFYVRYDGNQEVRYECIGDGDFRSCEGVKLLQETDIIITNPPFSLLLEYLKQLLEYDKRFLVIAHQHCFTYKGVFSAVKEGRLWLGYGFPGNVGFFLSDYDDYAVDNDRRDGCIRVSGVCWLTNLENNSHNTPMELTAVYDPALYPKYLNCDAIEVARTNKIPKDYYGLMGVPLTFLYKYCPEQFEIVGYRKGTDGRDLRLPGKYPYYRILIKRRVV